MRIPITFLVVSETRDDLLFLLNRLIEMNMYLYKTRNLPDLYQAGVRYRREKTPPGRPAIERWQCVDVLYQNGWGDCEDLACARIAYLRVRGERARVRLTKRKPGHTWHVTVRRADGTNEDPSALLGMV